MQKPEIQKGQEEERMKEKNEGFPSTGVDFVEPVNNIKEPNNLAT
jgi:hypothetical protein